VLQYRSETFDPCDPLCQYDPSAGGEWWHELHVIGPPVHDGALPVRAYGNAFGSSQNQYAYTPEYVP
jgi:hypothetical protein